GRNGRWQIEFSAQNLRSLFIAQRAERICGAAILCDELPRLFEQSPVKHGLRSAVDLLVELAALWIEAKAEDAKATKRIAALLPKLRHFAPRDQADFNGADGFWDIIGVDFSRGFAVKPPQDRMQVFRPFGLCTLAQPLPQIFGTLRPGEKPLQ